ncbi:hypothetical protein HGI10_66920 [Streptomyces collinus]|nr:hypothetical protein HGI10_66920 [Streptomyces collinus]
MIRGSDPPRCPGDIARETDRTAAVDARAADSPKPSTAHGQNGRRQPQRPHAATPPMRRRAQRGRLRPSPGRDRRWSPTQKSVPATSLARRFGSRTARADDRHSRHLRNTTSRRYEPTSSCPAVARAPSSVFGRTDASGSPRATPRHTRTNAASRRAARQQSTPPVTERPLPRSAPSLAPTAHSAHAPRRTRGTPQPAACHSQPVSSARPAGSQFDETGPRTRPALPPRSGPADTATRPCPRRPTHPDPHPARHPLSPTRTHSRSVPRPAASDSLTPRYVHRRAHPGRASRGTRRRNR